MKATFATFMFGTIHVNETHAHFITQHYIVAVNPDGTFHDLNGQEFRIAWPSVRIASPDAVLEVVVTQVVGRAIPKGMYSQQIREGIVHRCA